MRGRREEIGRERERPSREDVLRDGVVGGQIQGTSCVSVLDRSQVKRIAHDLKVNGRENERKVREAGW